MHCTLHQLAVAYLMHRIYHHQLYSSIQLHCINAVSVSHSFSSIQLHWIGLCPNDIVSCHYYNRTRMTVISLYVKRETHQLANHRFQQELISILLFVIGYSRIGPLSDPSTRPLIGWRPLACSSCKEALNNGLLILDCCYIKFIPFELWFQQQLEKCITIIMVCIPGHLVTFHLDRKKNCLSVAAEARASARHFIPGFKWKTDRTSTLVIGSLHLMTSLQS